VLKPVAIAVVVNWPRKKPGRPLCDIQIETWRGRGRKPDNEKN